MLNFGSQNEKEKRMKVERKSLAKSAITKCTNNVLVSKNDIVKILCTYMYIRNNPNKKNVTTLKQVCIRYEKMQLHSEMLQTLALFFVVTVFASMGFRIYVCMWVI